MGNLIEPTEVLVEFLRANITQVTRVGLSDNMTSAVQSFNGTGAQTQFVLTNSPLAIVSAVVDGSTLYKYNDYQVNLRTKTVTFTSIPGIGVNNVVITYYYGTNWIHRDRDRTEEDWNPESFPKIVVSCLSESGVPIGIGEDNYWDTITFQIDVLARKDQKCTIDGETREGQFVCDYLARRVRETFNQGDHRIHLTNTLENPVILRNIPLPFDQSHNIFRRIVEVQFNDVNVGL